jgi:hypothetical protein
MIKDATTCGLAFCRQMHLPAPGKDSRNIEALHSPRMISEQHRNLSWLEKPWRECKNDICFGELSEL